MSLSRQINNFKEETYQIYVEQCYKNIKPTYDRGEGEGKVTLFQKIFRRRRKITVFRLVFVKNGVPSYEEYTTHRELYERLISEKLVRNIYFPDTISVNEFIDLGFSLRYTFNR